MYNIFSFQKHLLFNRHEIFLLSQLNKKLLFSKEYNVWNKISPILIVVKNADYLLIFTAALALRNIDGFFILLLLCLFPIFFQTNSSPKAILAEEHLNFMEAFIKTFFLILVSEIGDKTFFIAAIMAMKHPRMMVFIGAISALALMTVISGMK